MTALTVSKRCTSRTVDMATINILGLEATDAVNELKAAWRAAGLFIVSVRFERQKL